MGHGAGSRPARPGAARAARPSSCGGIESDLLLRLLLVAGLIAANAFFVIAEYALVTARRSRIQQLAGEGSSRARLVLRLMDDPVRVISTVQVGITFLGILLGAAGEPALRELFEPVIAATAAVVLALVVVTFLSVWLGELVPKAIALHSAEQVALWVAAPIDFAGRVATPAVWLLQHAAGAVLRPLGIPTVAAGQRPVTREELRTVLEEAGDEGALSREEERMVGALIDLRGREISDVMTSWDDVVTVPGEASLDAAAAVVSAAPYSRYPALDGEGAVTGVLHLRELWHAAREGRAATVAELARSPVIVPPTAALPEVLRELRRGAQHMAIVTSEYGQMVGVATLEDILEEVVGEIEDEYDRPRRSIRSTGPGAWSVDAALPIAEVERRCGVALPAERDRTIGGLVFTELGQRPRPGDTVSVGDATLAVEAVEGHRIERVALRAAPPAEDR